MFITMHVFPCDLKYVYYHKYFHVILSIDYVYYPECIFLARDLKYVYYNTWLQV